MRQIRKRSVYIEDVDKTSSSRLFASSPASILLVLQFSQYSHNQGFSGIKKAAIGYSSSCVHGSFSSGILSFQNLSLVDSVLSIGELVLGSRLRLLRRSKIYCFSLSSPKSFVPAFVFEKLDY